MKIAITGATGQLGQLVVNKLKEKVPATDLVALVRSPGKAANLGIESREADYNNPGTLESALAGIDTLVLISGSEVGKRIAQHRAVIESAKKNGVQWILYTSILHADTTKISLAQEHLATEKELQQSKIPYTIMRNGWYTENYTGFIAGALAGGAFIGCAGAGKLSTAARADYAEAIVAVLTSEGHSNQVYEFAGDEAWTLSDLAAEISRQSGKEVPYVNMTEDEYAQALAGFGLPEAVAQAIASWDIAASKGDLFDDSRQLSKLLGRPTTPLSLVVENTIKNTNSKE
jgi:NAD(P)H dehydrogenase (quinone)